MVTALPESGELHAAFRNQVRCYLAIMTMHNYDNARASTMTPEHYFLKMFPFFCLSGCSGYLPQYSKYRLAVNDQPHLGSGNSLGTPDNRSRDPP